jgi:hypothetical protein
LREETLHHERYMRRAIEIARGNPDAPFGCVIAEGETGEIVAQGLNNAERNPILHGETAAVMDLVERWPDAGPRYRGCRDVSRNAPARPPPQAWISALNPARLSRCLAVGAVSASSVRTRAARSVLE